MKRKWIAILCVAATALAIIAYKQKTSSIAAVDKEADTPSVVLVADLGEADSGNSCAEIIRAVREAKERGVTVQELTPSSSSDLLARYRVVTIPTVIIIGRDGQEAARYQGEDDKTIQALKANLKKLPGV